MNIIVLGGGLVGGPIAGDLAGEKDFRVSVADVDQLALDRISTVCGAGTIRADLSGREEVTALVRDFDLVVNALPGSIGFRALQTVIGEGRNVVDIAFYPEDVFQLEPMAEKHGVILIADMGVAPGMSHLLTGYATASMQQVERVVIYVGGLPKVRQLPFEYKAVFSPSDVIEEYTRPARLVEHGLEVVKPALSEPELLFFPGVGTLEAFNSDGLRSLIRTIPAAFMAEKTLRYPGHADKIRLMSEIGLFSTEPVRVGELTLRPLDVTSRLLFPLWKMAESDRDITVMRIIVEGREEEEKVRHTFDLLDEYDEETGIHSMARTTGYAASMAVRLIAKGLWTRKGLTVPEYIGRDRQCVDFMLNGLADRGVRYRHTREVMDA